MTTDEASLLPGPLPIDPDGVIVAGDTEAAQHPELAASTLKSDSTLRHAIVLGSFTAIGAFGIDTYLPAFKTMAQDLHVPGGRIEATLVSFFIALAFGQLIYGPLADRYGRKPPLIIGFLIFIITSIGCALSTSIEMLIAMRFFQGFGACAGMVVPRAIVRDLRTGEAAARLFAFMLLVLGASPILAPLLGSLLLKFVPWQADFWFLAVLGVYCLVLCLFFLEETHPVHRRTQGGIGTAMKNYLSILGDFRFNVTVGAGGFSQGALFAYLAGSPLVYTEINNVSPEIYSLLFALNAIGLIGLAQINVSLMRKLGARPLVVYSGLIQSVSAAILLAAVLMGHGTVIVFATLLFIIVGVQGAVGPTTGMMALEPYGSKAGAASAVMGAIQFGCGALSSGVLSALSDGTAVPMSVVLLGCAILGLLCGLALLSLPPAVRESTSPRL